MQHDSQILLGLHMKQRSIQQYCCFHAVCKALKVNLEGTYHNQAPVTEETCAILSSTSTCDEPTLIVQHGPPFTQHSKFQ